MYKEVNRIILTQDNVNKLVDWKEHNKDLVRQRKDVLKNGIIEIQETSIYFEREFIFMHFKYFIRKQRYLDLDYNLVTKQVTITYEDKIVKEMTGNNTPALIQDIIMIHSTCMAYMEHHISNTVTKQRTQQSSKKVKNKYSGKKTSNIIYLKETIYKYNSIDTDKTRTGEYERHTISWKVRGHWREYKKTGKRVWIKEYKKGKKDENIQGKQYKLK